MEGTSRFCRACLVKYDDPNDLLQYTEKNRRQYFYLTGIQVKKNDPFIFQLCNNCYQCLIAACKFKKLCRTSDKQYKQYVALNEAGGIGDFEEFLRLNESTLSYPSSNEFSTPIYKPSQDCDNASTCTSFRSLVTDLMKADDDEALMKADDDEALMKDDDDELPDTAYKIIEEVIQEEADILDDSIDSEWLQEDLPPDLSLDFSFSMFRSPCKGDTSPDTTFASPENRTPAQKYDPFLPSLQPFTPTKDTTQTKENNTKSPLKIRKIVRNCRKQAKKKSVPMNKNEMVDATPVKELKVDNNESLYYDSTTTTATETSNDRFESPNKTGNIKEESDAKPNQYSLSKVKPKRMKRHFEEDYLHKNYVRRLGESRKTNRNNKNTHANNKTTRITKRKHVNLSDSLSLSECNISENDIIPKRRKRNNKKNTKITKRKVNKKDSLQSEFLSECNISEYDMIPIAENSWSNNDMLPLKPTATNYVTNDYNLQSEAPVISDMDTEQYQSEAIIPIKSTTTGQQEMSPKNLDMKQYFENFVEEINSDTLLDNTNTNSSTILENIKIKGLDDGKIIEKFIKDNKDSYSFSLDKLQHKLIVEMVKIFDTITRRCDLCNLNFISLLALKNHLSKIHKLKVPSKKKRKEVINKKESICVICGKMFAREKALKIHLKTHKSKEAYTCDICNTSFTNKSGMKMHIISHNQPDKINKSLTDTEIKHFPCDICGYKFKYKRNLVVHKKRHKIFKFQCQDCPKQFVTEPEFIIHVRSHTVEKPFKCTECPKNYTRKDSLNAHKREHDGTSFKCPYCRKKYVTKPRLNRHLENDKRCREMKRNEEENGKPKEEYNEIEIKYPEPELEELIIPEDPIPDLNQEVLLINPINYVEDEYALNIFPQNNYEKEYVINPSFF